MGFRADINGLRAIAVVAVILFHVKAPAITGGYAGVDVFFVISGYLMTGIIVGRLDRGTFSLPTFYADRARRILPALMAAVACLFALGYVLIEPSSFRVLAWHALTSLLFVSNVTYYQEAGYFDAPSEAKWLLHTWSLSVEWQFYLLYPIILRGIFLSEFLRRRLTAVLWALAGVSFALSVVLSVYRPEAAFFLLPARGWEMLAGGIVYMGTRSRAGRSPPGWPLQALGLALIAVAFLAFDRATPWPSWRALVPVAGTCLVIWANRPEAPWASHPATGTVGRWSYAAYIWHWPIIVLLGRYHVEIGRTATAALIVAVLAVGAALGAAGRRFGAARAPGGRHGLTVAFAALLVLTGIAYATQGMIWRADDPRLIRSYEAAFPDQDYSSSCGSFTRSGRITVCGDVAGGPGSVLFLGDSHAEMIYPRFYREGARIDPGAGAIVFATRGGCPPLQGVRRYVSGERCPAFFDQAMEIAGTGRFPKVVIAAFWTGYLRPSGPMSVEALDPICFQDGAACHVAPDQATADLKLDAAFADLARRLGDMTRRGVEVTILRPFPQPGSDLPLELERRAFMRQPSSDLRTVERARLAEANRTTDARLRDLAQRSGARLVDPMSFLCGAETCPMVDGAGQPLFRDASHFRASVVRSARFTFLDALVGKDRP